MSEDLKGSFYTFQIRIGDKWLDETPGIWAKAVGVNGNRAAVIDWAATDPEGWEEKLLRYYHLRDASSGFLDRRELRRDA